MQPTYPARVAEKLRETAELFRGLREPAVIRRQISRLDTSAKPTKHFSRAAIPA